MDELSFKPIAVEDRKTITSFTHDSEFLNCDFAFANMCSWRFLYDSAYTVTDGFLFIRFYVEEKGKKHSVYMFPLGNGDLRQAIDRIEKDAQTMGFPLMLLGLTPKSLNLLDSLFPGQFIYTPERDYFDYIYHREDLIQLTGKKYQSKRNHINKFKKQYEYAYLPITPDIAPQCMELERTWQKNNIHDKNKKNLLLEQRSMAFAISHFNDLGLLGGVITVNGKIIAFTYGSPVNKYTFGIHVEKADIEYEGIYSVINQEFALQIPEQYNYINREEDLGLPGLRKSKLSYHPAILLEKSTAVKRTDCR
jgi:hypothetical protein